MSRQASNKNLKNNKNKIALVDIMYCPLISVSGFKDAYQNQAAFLFANLPHLK